MPTSSDDSDCSSSRSHANAKRAAVLRMSSSDQVKGCGAVLENSSEAAACRPPRQWLSGCDDLNRATLLLPGPSVADGQDLPRMAVGFREVEALAT
jgi:hypothetical protein